MPATSEAFGDGAPFDAAPWPALVMTADGSVCAANAAAASLRSLLTETLPDPLAHALHAGVQGHAAELQRLDLGTPTTADGTVSRSFRVTVLPWRHNASCLVLARDITVHQQQWAAQQVQADRCCGLVAIIGDGFAWETDALGRLTYLSHPGPLGDPVNARIATNPVRYADDADVAQAVFQAQAPVYGAQLAFTDGRGETVPYRADAAPIHDHDGTWRGARGLCRDMTERRRAETALHRVRQREQLLYAILRVTREEAGPQAILDTAARGILPALDAEGAAVYRDTGDGHALVAHAGTIIPETAISDALQRIGVAQGEVATTHANVDVLTFPTRHGGQVNGALALWHSKVLGDWDADERALAAELAAQIAMANTQLQREREWRRLSESDSLTGLVNRRAFLAYLAEHLRAELGPGALLYIDLDNFKRVNDVRGHIAGDDVLTAVARLLRAHTRDNDVAARIGGDEFALFMTDITAETAMRRAATLAQTAREALTDESGDPGHPLGTSIGVATTNPTHRESATDLLERADIAMYRAKRAGKGDVAMADPPTPRAGNDYPDSTSA
jgi:diguanylate cyclase (GGDEF)-like protein